MKYQAEIVVKVNIEAKNEKIARELIKANPFFIKVRGAGIDGVYSIESEKEQSIIFFKNRQER